MTDGTHQSTSPPDPGPPGKHSPRERFDSLLSDPRHHRGDFRMIRAALREGRLNSLTQDERDALCQLAAGVGLRKMHERETPTGTDYRAFFSFARLMLDMSAEDQRAYWQAQGRMLPGRPRRRPRLDTKNRIDATAYRRELKARGELLTVATVEVLCDSEPHPVDVSWVPDRRYGWRLFWLCPACGERKRFLYGTKRGPRCRVCSAGSEFDSRR